MDNKVNIISYTDGVNLLNNIIYYNYCLSVSINDNMDLTVHNNYDIFNWLRTIITMNLNICK